MNITVYFTRWYHRVYTQRVYEATCTLHRTTFVKNSKKKSGGKINLGNGKIEKLKLKNEENKY